MKALGIGVVGLGKIATDQHLPAIAANPSFELVATVERSGAESGINFKTHQAMLRNAHRLDAVAITTPPGPRYAIARDCIDAGLHVLLEKPPTSSLAQIDDLHRRAAARGVTLFTTWHAQHNGAVIAAAELLAGQAVRKMTIIWHEDVDKWHPDQRWIWEAGGFGVFDPGINAFSIASLIFPGQLVVNQADLYFPPSSQTPVAAEIIFEGPDQRADLRCSLDWRRPAEERWTISILTDNGLSVELTDGGSRLLVDQALRAAAGTGEYPDIYLRFHDLIRKGQSHVDSTPLRMVADCLLVGKRHVLAQGSPAL